MAEKTLGAEFLIHGGGLDLVFPHHENERAQSQAVGRPFARIWMHNGLLRFTGEKMSKSVGNVATIQEVIAEWGRETALLFMLTGHWRKPIDFSEETMIAGARAGRGPAKRVARRNPLARRLGSVRRSARRRLQHPRRRSRSCTNGHATGLSTSSGEGSPSSGSARSQSARRRRPSSMALRRAAAASSCGQGFRRGRPTARCDRRRRVGGARRARRLRARAVPVTRELVYGRNAVREALRGRREVLELWASERAAARARLAAQKGRARSSAEERELTEAAGSTDHQGVVALAEPYPYADAWELAAGELPLLVCLDQVTDPRNLGAVIRSAAGAGATGVDRAGTRLRPRHGRRLSRLRGGRRAPARSPSCRILPGTSRR